MTAWKWKQVVFAVLSLGACTTPRTEEAVVAWIGEESIPVGTFRATVERRMGVALSRMCENPRAYETLRAMLEHVIDEQILIREALRHGVQTPRNEIHLRKAALRAQLGGEVDPEAEARMWSRSNALRLLLTRVTPVSDEVSDLELRRAFEERAAWFSTLTEAVELWQVLVPTGPVADEVYRKLRGGADFAEIARTYSIAAEGKQGGALGWVGKGMLPVSVEIAAFSMEPGIGPPAQSPYGFHILRVGAKRSAKSLTVEDVRSTLTRDLLAERRRREGERFLQELRRHMNVKINDNVLRKLAAGDVIVRRSTG